MSTSDCKLPLPLGVPVLVGIAAGRVSHVVWTSYTRRDGHKDNAACCEWCQARMIDDCHMNC